MVKLNSIQVLRAVAVLAVLFCHAWGTGRGSSGVDLFFVISGFIIARVSADRTPAAFAKARFLRIFPLYLLAAAPYVAVSLSSGGTSLDVFATLTLWPIWSGAYHAPLLPVAWSLYFEVLFYAGVTLWLVSRRGAVLAAATILLAAVIHPSPTTSFVLSPIILEFVAGYGLARLRRFPLAPLALGLGLLLLFSPIKGFEGVEMLDPAQAFARLIMYGIPALMVVYGALGMEHAFEPRWATPLIRVGDASYSIYLTHLMAVHSPLQWPPAANMLLAILLGFAAFKFVEKPLLRIGRRKRLAGSAAGNRVSSLEAPADVVLIGATLAQSR
jgi:exopolysaccharide production protein ExoZ